MQKSKELRSLIEASQDYNFESGSRVRPRRRQVAPKQTRKARKPANKQRDFSKVQPMKEFHPTEEEFMEPIKYVEKLYAEGAWKYGCIKIIPPTSYTPPFSLDTSSQSKMPFRSQVLQNLTQGKPFGFNKEGMTYSEFKSKAESLQEAYLADMKNLSEHEKFMEFQRDYWSIVDNGVSSKLAQMGKYDPFLVKRGNKYKFHVDYAADLPTNKYGSGFPS